MRASGLLTRPGAVTYLCIAVLWGACLAGIVLLHEKTSRAADIHRLGAFSIRALQLGHELLLEQIESGGYAAADQSAPARESLQARYETTKLHTIAYRTARGRFNERRFGSDLSASLKSADARLDRLDRIRSDILSGKADFPSIIDFYSGLTADLAQPIYRLRRLKPYRPDLTELRIGIAALTKLGLLAAREGTLGTALAAGMQLDPRLLAEWQSMPARYKSLRAAYESSGNASALADLTVAQDSETAREVRSMIKRIRDGTVQPLDEALQADLRSALSENLRSIRNLAIAKLSGTNTGSRSITLRNGFIVAVLVVVAALATLALIHRRHADVDRQTFIVLLLAFNLALTVWALTTGPNVFSHETGPLETLQALAIVIAFALFCREALSGTGSSRTAAVILAAACFLMFFREADFRLLGAPDSVTQFTNGPVRRVLFLVLALIVAGYAALRRTHLPRLAHQTLSFSAWPLFAWAVLLVTGEAVEAMAHLTRKDDLPGYWAGGQFFEELLELNAYIALVLAAWVFGSIYPSKESTDGLPNGTESREKSTQDREATN